MTIILDLPEPTQRALQRLAAHRGQDPATVVRSLVDEAAAGVPETQTLAGVESPPLADGVNVTEPEKQPYDPQAAAAVLRSFLEQDEQEHRETLELLMRVVDEDRPGQRRVFGEGYNP